MSSHINSDLDLASKIAGRSANFRRAIVSALIAVSVTAAVSSSHAQSVTLSTTSQQTFTGFGGAVAFEEGLAQNAPSSSVQNQFCADMFEKLPIQYVRFSIDPSFETSNGHYSWSNANSYHNLSDCLKFARAKNPNIKFLGSIWSPPAWMKANNSVVGGGSNNWLSTPNYNNFATYCAQYCRQFNSNMGFPLQYISPQNEPDQNAGYLSCTYYNKGYNTWPNDYITMAGDVTSAVHNASSTQTVGCEFGTPLASALEPFLSKVGGNIDIAAVHSYVTDMSSIPTSYQTLKTLWMTEFCFQGYSQLDTNSWSQAQADGHALARSWGTNYSTNIAEEEYGPKLSSQLGSRVARDINLGKVSAWMWWELARSAGSQEGEGLAEVTQTPGSYTWTSYRLTRKYYALKAIANTISPGATINAATSDNSDIDVVGCKNSNGTYGLVVANSSDNNHGSVTITIRGLSGSGRRSFTRILTDPNNDYSTSTVTFFNGVYTDNLPSDTVICYLAQSSSSGGGFRRRQH